MALEYQILVTDKKIRGRGRGVVLCFLNLEMLRIKHSWGKIVSDYFALLSPTIIHRGEGDVLVVMDEAYHVIRWPIRINSALFVQKLVDCFLIAQDNHVGTA